MGIRHAPRYNVVEFRWPLGREIPQSIRRMNVQEFCVALELVSNTMDHLKDSILHHDTTEELEKVIQEKEDLHTVFKNEKADIVQRYEKLLNTYQRSLVEVKTAPQEALQSVITQLKELQKKKSEPCGLTTEVSELLEKISEQYCMLEAAIASIPSTQ